jgi:hypothetical protein
MPIIGENRATKKHSNIRLNQNAAFRLIVRKNFIYFSIDLLFFNMFTSIVYIRSNCSKISRNFHHIFG